MSSPFSNKIHILSPKPGTTVWYSRIPDIVDWIFRKGNYHDFRPQVNEIFQKDHFIEPFLSDLEIHTVNSFKALKKQVEWMCGRYLLKRMMADLFLTGLSLDRITFSYLEQGAPFVVNLPHIPVSLSHSNEYTAAACSFDTKQNIGIDIEKIGPEPDDYFLKTAFTRNEILTLEKNAGSIFKHWTIKEAYLKYIKKGFNESLHKVEVIHDEIFYHGQKADVDIFSRTVNPDYVLSLVSNRS